MTPNNYDNVIQQLEIFGLDLSNFEIGRMKRCRVEGERGSKGWYILHELVLDSGVCVLVGSYGIWHGDANNAQKIVLDKDHKPSKEENAAIRKRMVEDRKRAEADRARQAAKSAKRAEIMWQKCSTTGTSDYLDRKQINASGLKFTKSGALVVPMCDTSGKIHGLQFILSKSGSADRIKRTGRDKEFWPVGLAKKGHFHMLGVPAMDGVLLITEGYATAASLFEATGHAVAVAFDAGNLLPVAENLKKRYKRARILVCADDDFIGKCSECKKMTVVADAECSHCGKPHGKKNTGLITSSKTALAVGGEYILPKFADRGTTKLTDWNDLHVSEGEAAVRVQIEDIVSSLGWDAPVQASVGAALTGGAGEACKADLVPMITVADACRRYSLVYGVKDTMFDHQEHDLVPKSCVMDIMPDHGWREWKSDPDRKLVRMTEVGFDPAETDKNIKCNMWGGWPTTPSSKGSCDKLLELIEFLCSHEDESRKVFKWVMKWLAYPIQNPGAKMKTAVVMHGPTRVGKNLFFEAVMAIYGEYGRVIGQPELEEKFNSWAGRKLFLIANEVASRQELFHQKNKIKALVTDDWIHINPKNQTPHDERNHLNLVFLSNEAQPVVPDPDDERFAVIWTPKRRGKDFYLSVIDEINHGGIEALHQHLLGVEMGDFHSSSPPPMTDSKERLVNLSKDSVQRFFEDWQSGETPHPFCACLRADLYEAYRRWCSLEGEKFPRSQIQFTTAISRFDGIDSMVTTIKKGMGEALGDQPFREAMENKSAKIYFVGDDIDAGGDVILERTRIVVRFNQSLKGDDDAF